MTDVPPSLEHLTEDARRSAIDLDDFELDLSLALTVARRDVNAAHGRHTAAEAWQGVVLALDDMRRTRARVRREIEDLTEPNPFRTVRHLTAEELAEVRFDDEPMEPPC